MRVNNDNLLHDPGLEIPAKELNTSSIPPIEKGIPDESDLFVRCLKCKHQKVDHDRTASRDKMKCLIGNCNCKKFIEDRRTIDRLKNKSKKGRSKNYYSIPLEYSKSQL